MRLIEDNHRFNSAGVDNAISAFMRILTVGLVTLGGLGGSYMLYKATNRLDAQAQLQNAATLDQMKMIESVRGSNMALMVNNVLDQVSAELRNSPSRTLSDRTISWIAALSSTLRPYAYQDQNGKSQSPLSPERGELLLALSGMKLDPGSFEKIRVKSTFSMADLGGVNLEATDLSGINLSGANLSGADLRGVNLSNAVLRMGDLRGANLERGVLNQVDLERSDLRWVNLSKADLHKAHLDGADFRGATLAQSNLMEVSLRYADLRGVLFDQANLTRCTLFFSRLTEARLTHADLDSADLRKADLIGANLTGAELSGAIVHLQDWLERLDEWNVVGRIDIQQEYDLIPDTTQDSKHELRRNLGGK